MAAQRGKPALAGEPALIPRKGMVQVAAGGGPAAAGSGAPGAAGADQVLEPAAGLVPGFRMAVVAAAAGHRGQPDPQRAQVVPGSGVGGRPLVLAAAGAGVGGARRCGPWGRWYGC